MTTDNKALADRFADTAVDDRGRKSWEFDDIGLEGFAAALTPPQADKARGEVRWITQTTFYDPAEPDANNGNCTEAAIASILGLPLSAVPDWRGIGNPEFWDGVEAFIGAHGFDLHMMPGNYQPDGLYLASGQSPRGAAHMVVMRDGKLAHDPHPSRAGIDPISHIWLLVPKDPAATTPQPQGDASPEDCDMGALCLGCHPRAKDGTCPDASRPTDDDLWDKTLTDRDRYHDAADKLADLIAQITGEDIGEHSSSNQPWAMAAYAAENYMERKATPQVSGGGEVDAKKLAEGLYDWMVDVMPNGNLLNGAVVCDHAGAQGFKRSMAEKIAKLSALSTTQARPDGGEWVPVAERVPTAADADEIGDVVWLRGAAECLGRVASGAPVDATHWKPTGRNPAPAPDVANGVPITPIADVARLRNRDVKWQQIANLARQADIERDHHKARSERLARIGGLLANAAYNLAQGVELTDTQRASLGEMRKAWDAALNLEPNP